MTSKILFPLLPLFFFCASCGQNPKPVVELNANPSFEMPANLAWKPTGLTIGRDDCLEINATGQIEIDRRWRGTSEVYDFLVGPQGTYSLAENAFYQNFPLPSGNAGPIPAYSLLGKIGPEGEPFFVGRKRRVGCAEVNKPAEPGELYLGINDFDLSDNQGKFLVSWSRGPFDDSMPKNNSDSENHPSKEPRVMTIYIDGLRPDVLYQMAYNGFLPNIKSALFDRGIFYENAFTVFPSDTVTSNSAWMTGTFTDKTGVKSQSEFDRQDQSITTYLDKFTPTLGANLLRPVDEFRVGKTIAWIWRSIFGPKKRAEELHEELTQGVDAIYDYCEKNGIKFGATALPILNPHPPKDWLSVFSNSIEWPISAIKAVKSFDRGNSAYAYRYLINEETRVVSLWFPGVDVGSHFSARGQFGPALKYLSEADHEIGLLVEKLKRRNLYEDTTFILFSDHGHIGGKNYINQNFNLPFELFYLPSRDDDQNGVIDAQSGLGFNVRKNEYERTHAVNAPDDYVYFDIGSYGSGKVFLPFGARTSKDWQRRNGYYQLTHYQVAESFEPVNLLERVLQKKPRNSNLYPGIVLDQPLAFVMLAVSGEIAPPASGAQSDPVDRLFIKGADGSEALVEHRMEAGIDQYRYIPIANFDQDESGKISFQQKGISRDPLGYMKDMGRDFHSFASQWSTGRQWLERTATFRFPNGPEFYYKFFHWHPIREKWQERKSPDFVFVANEGWTVRHEDVLSTDHGYAERESMNIALLVAGPGSHQGVISPQPVYNVDILPTILNILDVPYDEKFVDGKPFPDFFANAKVDPRYPLRAQQLELGAVRGQYRFAGLDADLKWEQFGLRPPPEPANTLFHAHDLSRYGDLHNVVADVFIILNYEIFYGFDVVFDLLVPGMPYRPLTHATEAWLRTWDRFPDSWAKRRTGQFFAAAHARELSFLDTYSVVSLVMGDSFAPIPTSLGFLTRYFDTIDWCQDLLMDLSGAVSYPFGKKDLLGMRFFNQGIDWIEDPLIFGQRMITKYGLELGDKGALRFEDSIDFFANIGRREPREVLNGYPGHIGCSCNNYIVDMEHEKSKTVQGGRGLNVPAPAQMF